MVSGAVEEGQDTYIHTYICVCIYIYKISNEIVISLKALEREIYQISRFPFCSNIQEK